MSAMEQSLRRALEAGDAANPIFRESIYSASERALERMIEARGMDEEAAQLQRIRLAETINRVEQDHFLSSEAQGGDQGVGDYDGAGGRPHQADEPATQSLDDALETPDAWFPAEDDDRSDDGGSTRPDAPADPLAEDQAVADAQGDRSAFGLSRRQPGTRAKRRFRLERRGASLALAGLLVLAAAAYFAYEAVMQPGSARSTVSEPPAAGGPQTTFTSDGEWIDLFTGTQLESISTRLGATADQVSGTVERPLVRLAASSAGGEIGIAIGPGVIGEIAGRTVRVEITVGSPDGGEREFRVRCLFASETICGSQRFSTAQQSQTFVFDMAVPQKARASGEIAFAPGFGTPAKAIDLYSVRVRNDLPS